MASRREGPPQPPLFAVRGQIGRRQYWALALIGLVVPLLLWWAVSASGMVTKTFMPGPVHVWDRAVLWFTEDDLMADIGISVYRVVAGWGLSALIAIPLGLAIGTYRPVQALLEPLTDFIRYMPAVAFIPLVMLWIGIAESSKIAIIWIGTFFQMVLIVANTTRQLDRSLVEAAQTLGASRRQLVRHVIVPGVLPQLYADLRILLGWAWTYLFVAELIGAKSGVTAFVAQQSRYFNFDLVYAAIIVIGVIGLVTDQVLQYGARFFFPWQRRPIGPVARVVWSALTFVPRRLASAARAQGAARTASTQAPAPAIAQERLNVAPS